MKAIWYLTALFLAGMNIIGADRLRLIVETDAGGDPDDEQSLVRFLLYANEWDVEGIIANRPRAREGENRNKERTGLGIVRRQLTAYGECWPNLVQHDERYPARESLWTKTVPGYNDTDDAVRLIVAAVDSPDPRPIWYSDWGTDVGADTNNLKRALDQVLATRGPEGYKKFKSRLRLASADAFGDHTFKIAPPFPLWVDTFRPEIERKRWYHRFFAITARAGGFDLMRDVLTGHGPLGALYPTNTTHWQKEGDTMTFLYLVPTGMNEPEQPGWGSWAGRYGRNENHPALNYYWANQVDSWNGTTNRDNTLARWAEALQNDFRARLDWCVKPRKDANHPPTPTLAKYPEKIRAGSTITLDASASSDPDGDPLSFRWSLYREAGTFSDELELPTSSTPRISFIPKSSVGGVFHVVVSVTDHGTPALTRYSRAIIRITP